MHVDHHAQICQPLWSWRCIGTTNGVSKNMTTAARKKQKTGGASAGPTIFRKKQKIGGVTTGPQDLMFANSDCNETVLFS